MSTPSSDHESGTTASMEHTATPYEKKPLVILLLSALYRGKVIEHEGVRYAVEDDELWVIGKRYTPENKEGEDVYLTAEVTLHALADLAKQIGRDQLYIYNCECALREMTKKRRRS